MALWEPWSYVFLHVRDRWAAIWNGTYWGTLTVNERKYYFMEMPNRYPVPAIPMVVRYDCWGEYIFIEKPNAHRKDMTAMVVEWHKED